VLFPLQIDTASGTVPFFNGLSGPFSAIHGLNASEPSNFGDYRSFQIYPAGCLGFTRIILIILKIAQSGIR